MSSKQKKKSKKYSPDDENFKSFISLLWRKKWDDAFELLQSHNEMATMAKDVLLYTVLHEACQRGAPLRLIDELIRINPDLPDAKNCVGVLPLHYLALGPADPAVVQRMLQANPSAIKTQDIFGRLPLHFAAGNKRITAESFEIFFAAYREGARVADNDGQLPLHEACYCLMKNNNLEILLAAYPEGACVADKDGLLPLHSVCHRLLGHDNLCQILSSLMQANPAAVSTPDNNDHYPFHHMLRAILDLDQLSSENVRGFKMILRANGGVASTPYDGGLPLHHALNNPPSTVNSSKLWSELITSLFKSYPGAVNFADGSGQHPLHVACRKLFSDCKDVLALLVNANPAVLNFSDNEGKTPINYACGRRDVEEFGPMLFSVSPSGMLSNKLKRINAANEELVVAFARAMVRNDALENLPVCKKRRFSF